VQKPAKVGLDNQGLDSRKQHQPSLVVPTVTSPAQYQVSDGNAIESSIWVSSTEIDWAFRAIQGYNRGQYYFLSGVAGTEFNALRIFAKKEDATAA